MKVLKSIILSLPLLLFSIENSDHERTEESYTPTDLKEIDPYKDQNSINNNEWLLKALVEGYLVNELKAQVKEGGLDNSEELVKTIDNLEVEIERFAQKLSPIEKRQSKPGNQLFIKTVACSCKIETEDDCTENEYTEEEIREQIEALREQEQLKKDEALELALQAGSEILSAAGYASVAYVPGAIYDGGRAVQHIKGACEEYSESVRISQEADYLEDILNNNDEIVSEEEVEETKSWWEFWK